MNRSVVRFGAGLVLVGLLGGSRPGDAGSMAALAWKHCFPPNPSPKSWQ